MFQVKHLNHYVTSVSVRKEFTQQFGEVKSALYNYNCYKMILIVIIH